MTATPARLIASTSARDGAVHTTGIQGTASRCSGTGDKVDKIRELKGPGKRYNVFAIPLAAGVLAAQGILLALAFAAVLMSASMVIVAVNAQLLRRARP